MKKILLTILGIFLLLFFFLPIFPPAGQGCSLVVIPGQQPCKFKKETAFQYFFKYGGTLQDLKYNSKI